MLQQLCPQETHISKVFIEFQSSEQLKSMDLASWVHFMEKYA